MMLSPLSRTPVVFGHWRRKTISSLLSEEITTKPSHSDTNAANPYRRPKDSGQWNKPTMLCIATVCHMYYYYLGYFFTASSGSLVRTAHSKVAAGLCSGSSAEGVSHARPDSRLCNTYFVPTAVSLLGLIPCVGHDVAKRVQREKIDYIVTCKIAQP